jgi:recombination protein RecT
MTQSISPLVAMQGTLEKMADKFTEALPRQMDVNKFISVAKLTLNKNPKLLQADKTSLMQTFMKSAQDGLYLDGKEASAVLYGNQVNYLPMVEGVIKLMHNSGLIKTISAEVVYENDCFEYELGSNPHVKHIPLLVGDRGNRICVYCYVQTANDGEYIEIMNMDDVNKCKQQAKGASSPHSPWVKWFDQMAKKTVIHRIAKRLPKNDAINSVVRIEEDNMVDITPNARQSTEPKDSLSRLRESIGMDDASAEQAKEEVLNNYRKEE